MSRHCTCDDIETCRLCYLFHNDPKYRAKWEDAIPQPAPPVTFQAVRKLAVGILVLSQRQRAILNPGTGSNCGECYQYQEFAVSLQVTE